MKHCPHCGAENQDGATFCGLCHAGLVQMESPSTYIDQVHVSSYQQYPADLKNKFENRRKKRLRSLIWAGGMLALLVIIAGVVIASVTGGSAKKITSVQYKSASTGLSFQYPSNLEKKDVSFLKNIALSGDAGAATGNEIVLIQRGVGMFKHLLVVSSGKSPKATGDWEEDVKDIMSGYQVGGYQANLNIKFQDAHMVKAPNAHGFIMSYEAPSGMTTMYIVHAFILQDQTAYQFVLATKTSGDKSEQMDARGIVIRLLKTVSVQ